ncbi:Aste57867_18196 [Aphanomyces stellatus]|uniref:Kinesin-like protein n=1 Tax=Aphanomyces stellatus TaxID=120398 RepID=A0A485LD64_9STRA|nr:hypothetical protein As57867_018134 [Aphanomyces stellatus]VFT94934.1 Aste57867_18196 [Aphanomyces stellatus]
MCVNAAYVIPRRAERLADPILLGFSAISSPGMSTAMDDSEDYVDIPSMIVAVRMRPISQTEQLNGHRSCCRVVGDQTVIIEKPGIPLRHLKSQRGFSNEYAYDMAFPDCASQDEVYARTVRNIIPTILKGFNATIFACVMLFASWVLKRNRSYGATGAGKTHTMMGSERDGCTDNNQVMDDDDDEVPQVDGIIPHSLTDIFRLIAERRAEQQAMMLSDGTGFRWNVVVTYLEVYNEQIRDLLNPSNRPLALREDPVKGVVNVAGLHHVEVRNSAEVLQLLRSGNGHRRTESTAANQVSSRSHAVLQVSVKHTTTTMIGKNKPHEATTEGVLSLIDLAGSERASNTHNTGMRLTEGANINKSLLALANCINALSSTMKDKERRRSDSSVALRVREKPAPRTKYRDSKLTHLLKSSLEGDCRLIMIANINPSHACFEETHNTLKYANRAKNIRIRPKKHVVTAEMTHLQRADRLEQENAALRRALQEARSGEKRKSMDEDMMNGLYLDNEPKRAKHDELNKTIEQLRRDKRQLQARVVELESANRLLQKQVTIAERPKETRVSNNQRNAVHPMSYKSRHSMIPRLTPPSSMNNNA